MSSPSPSAAVHSPSDPRPTPTSTVVAEPTLAQPCTGASASCDIEDLVEDSDSSSDDDNGAKPVTQDPSKQLYPTVPFYGPCIIRGLKPGEKKRWCTCGLSKTQPWCDNAHRGTPFKPHVWKVPDKPQTIYSICNCKYTKYVRYLAGCRRPPDSFS
ncbi:hypothetical protein BCR44DRAFT_127221 [Catenaria anguillulae PL171]|uniref:Iron-binding zinc finger CDGSH type domain-containing protein n=1 Tax=Catenaria anguillulae PL171 TaxID=765915 RepID=A0A1Y2HKK3_9FUNG|nr:hypothetical protein BCR44DRAFT_127221 [Catenaria anguillulae PL171]